LFGRSAQEAEQGVTPNGRTTCEGAIMTNHQRTVLMNRDEPSEEGRLFQALQSVFGA
jgi:hypothetical protein